MNQHTPTVTYDNIPVSFAHEDLTIPPTPTRTAAAFVLHTGPLSGQVRGLAQQIAARIEAGHYRRLPSTELSGLRLLTMVLAQIASRFAIAEDLTPAPRRVRGSPWWLPVALAGLGAAGIVVGWIARGWW